MKYFYYIFSLFLFCFLQPNVAKTKSFEIYCGNDVSYYHDEDTLEKSDNNHAGFNFSINLEEYKIAINETFIEGETTDDVYVEWDIKSIDNGIIKYTIGDNKKLTIHELDLKNLYYKTRTEYNNISIDKSFRIISPCTENLELAKILGFPFEDENNKILAASSGTGFFVSFNGHMVTNNHVIEACDIVKAHYNGKELNADVLFVDRVNDLAIIKTNIKPKRVFPVSDKDVSLLEDIIVAGYPLGKNISASIKTFKGSVTALAGFGDNFSNFQIDASLSSGNSGGPILNQKGNVVGVAVEKLVEVGVEGFNFGVKSSTLNTFASSNQFKFQDPSTEELSNNELGQLITEATIYLECWMSVAKIKQLIEEGERQKAFFSNYK